MNNSRPLVSIALCTFNGSRHLAHQLLSLIQQTYTNLEIIVVDDCSTDDTLQVIELFAAKDARVKHFVNSQNLGFNKNFEKALTLTTGDFIAISDQDDIWERDKIEVLLNNIGDNWMVFSNSEMIDEEGKLLEKGLLEKFEIRGRNYKSLLLLNFVTGHTSLISRIFLPYILPFPQTGYYDWWMGIIALYHKKLVYIDRKLTHYRIHHASVTQANVTGNESNNKITYYNDVLTLQANFAGYKGLSPKDKAFVFALRKAYAKRTKDVLNAGFIKLLVRHYTDLFPQLKKRGLLSRINFARRYARPIK